MRKARHALVLTDRGFGSPHRWAPSCVCGEWSGVPRRRRKEAVEQYGDHRHAVNARARHHPPRPRPTTPPEDWPDAFRSPPADASVG